MSSAAPEGAVAGRLIVPVESSTKGFKQKLKEKIDAAAAGLNANIGVELEAKKLRKELQARVDEAAAGVTAKIGIDLDAKSLAIKIKAAAKAAKTKIEVTADTDGLVAKVVAEAKAAEKAAPSILVSLKTRGSLAKDAVKQMLAARAATKGGIDVPVNMGGGLGGSGGGRSGMRIGRLLKTGLMASLVSLVEPLVGVIGQAVGGLTAMVGAADDAVGAVAAIPLAVSAGAQALIGLKVATQGVGDAVGLLAEKEKILADGGEYTAEQQAELDQKLKDLAPSARVAAKAVAGLSGDWTKVRKAVQGEFFRPFAREITPLAKVMLPLLETGLKRTARTMGELVKETAEWMQTGVFQKQFAQTGEQNNATIKAGAGSLLDFAKAFLYFQTAAAPFQKRMDGVIRSVGEWALSSAKTNAANGDTERFLDRAGDKLGQLWNITKQFSGGIGGILSAGTGSGNRLLTQFEGFLTRWNEWTHSDSGREYLTNWFDDVEPGFVELGRLINSTFKGMAKWATDPKIAKLLETIRTELGPALGDLLKDLSDDTSEGIIDFFTQLTRTLGNLAPAIEPVSSLTSALTGLLKVLNDIGSANPGVTENVAKLLGVLLALRTLKKVPGLGGALGGKGGGGGLASLLGAGALGGAAAKGGKHAAKAPKGGGGLLPVLAAALGIKSGMSIQEWLGRQGSPGKEEGDPFKQFQKPKGGFQSFLTGGGHTLSRDVGKAVNSKKSEWATGVEKSFAGLIGTDSGVTKALKNVEKLDSALAKMKSPSERQAAWSRVLKETGVSAENLRKVLPKTVKAMAETGKTKLGDSVKRAGDAFTEMMKKSAAASRVLETVPKDIRTFVSTPGLITSLDHMRSLQKEYHLTPKQVRTIMELQGFDETQTRIVLAGKAYKRLPKQIKTAISTPGAITSLDDVNRLVKVYNLTPKQKKTLMEVTGTDTSRGRIKLLQAAIQATKNKIVHMDEKGAQAARARITAMRLEIGRLQSKSVTLTTNVVKNFQTNYGHGPRASGPATAQAFGSLRRRGVQYFAAGGFADDKANAHKPKIYPPGPTRVFREPETKGEAYIPLANDHRRPRARDIASKTVELLGGTAYFARGGVTKKKRPSPGQNRLSSFVRGSLDNYLQGSAAQVDRGEDLLVARLIGAGRSKGGANAVLRSHTTLLNKIEALAKRRDGIASKLAAAQTKLDDLRSGRASIYESIKDAATDFGSLATVASANGGYLSPASLISELTRRVGEQTQFGTALANLRGKGLTVKAYEQIASMGAGEGLPLAKQLATASKAQITQINSLQGKITSAASSLGSATQKAYYDAGIKATAGLVSGLKRSQTALNKVATNMAKALVTSVKRQLRIKSPSRVMAEIGGHTADGIGVGLSERQKSLTNKARSMADQLAKDLTPSASGTSYLSDLRSSRAASDLRRADIGGGLAPLIGDLTIKGESSEQIRDGLDQTMFALRKLRQGGVYAQR